MKRHILILFFMHGIIAIAVGIISYLATSVMQVVIAIILGTLLFAFFIRWFYNNAHNAINIRKAEAEFARGLVSAERTHYQKIAEIQETLSIFRHDFKYHLKVIDGLLQIGDTERIGIYLAEIRNQMPDNELHYYCADSVINALLANYAKNCEKLDIKYNAKIALPSHLPVPRYDLCIILGNLLENALEACKKLGSGGEIDLAVKTNERNLAIMVKNTFDGVVSEKDGELTSTKKDGGFGLRSVRTIAERYNGYVSIDRTKNVFAIYVMVNT